MVAIVPSFAERDLSTALFDGLWANRTLGQSPEGNPRIPRDLGERDGVLPPRSTFSHNGTFLVIRKTT